MVNRTITVEQFMELFQLTVRNEQPCCAIRDRYTGQCMTEKKGLHCLHRTAQYVDGRIRVSYRLRHQQLQLRYNTISESQTGARI